MKAEMVVTGVILIATLLSFTLLFKARRFSHRLWLDEPHSKVLSPKKGTAEPSGHMRM